MFGSKLLHLHGFFAEFSQLFQIQDAAGRPPGRRLRNALARWCGAALLTACVLSGAYASSNPVPFVGTVSPVSATPGSMGVTLTVRGAGFVGTSVVEWNGIALTTTFVSAIKLTAAVPDSFLAALGVASITVVSSGVPASNVTFFPVAALEASTVFPSTPSSSVTVGDTPQGIVTGDFNGDGKLDIAAANNGDGTVSVLLGNGDGTFTTKSTPTAGSGANWVATGDFNNDGKLDLAVANLGSSGSAGVSILLGNGDGTFTLKSSPNAGDGPYVVVVADFNRDGKLDLAVANSNDNTVTILLGNGDGTFTFKATLNVGSEPFGMIVGDFDEDGKLDLAVANTGGTTLSILLGNGDGTFQTQTTVNTGGSGSPLGMIAADFNGDGHVDLAAVQITDVAILLGNGSGGFTLHQNAGSGTVFISGVTGDFNGDGKLDLVVSDQGAGEAVLLLGNGAGTFGSQTTYTTAANSFGTAAADFNGDGGLDFAISNGGAASVSIFLQQLPVELAPTSLAFGNQGVGSTSSPAKTVTLTNHSGSSLNISSIAFTGADSGDFARPGGTCSTSTAVLNNSSCTLTVNFTPGATGARTGTLTITDNAGNSPQTLGLTGTGTVSVPTISKAFGASTIALEGTTSLSFTVTNPVSNSISLTGVAFSDTFPSGLLISTPNGLTGSCGGGTITATAGVGSLSLSGATIAASGSCTFSVNVVGITAGAQANTTGTVSSNESGAGATSNTATVTVISPPVISKVFGAASVPLNGSTSLSFTIQNNNTTQSLSGIGFSDTLPAGLVISTPSGLTGVCDCVSATATQGTNVISLTGAALSQSTSCTFSVNVTGTSAGQQNNISSAVTSTEGGTGGTASASLAVVAPPAIAKAFGAAAIAVNGTTSLTFTVTNPAANTMAETGVAFTDTLPTGLVVATPNGLTNTCGGTATAVAGSTSVSLTGGTTAANTSCAVVVNASGMASGQYTNTTGNVTSTNGGTGNTGSANLTVASPPAITKSFGAATIPLNGTTSLTLSISNPNTGVTLTGLAFTDSLPAGLVVATPNSLSSTCGGTATAVAGAGSASLSGGTLAASASCTVSLNVQGTTAGAKNNSVQVTSTEGGTGNTSNASITVVSPPVIIKAFGAASVALNGATSLTFTIQNNNTTQSLSGIAFSDTLPAGLVVATPNGLTGTCGGGTITAVAGLGSVSLSGSTLAASSSCNFSVNVTGTAAGAQNNTTGAVTSTNGGTGGTASASLAVVAPPSISKAFGAASIPPSGATSLSFTITNPGANTVSLTGVAFTDTLPANLVLATPNGLTGSCGGGTITATAGSGSASLSGAVLTTNSSCAFAVNVTGSVNGNYTNTTGAVTSTNGGTGNTASANLSVNLPTTITSANSATFAVGAAGSFSVTSTGVPTPALTKTGSLPGGVTFTDNGNGTATLSGTPAASTGGAYSITITAANGVGTNATQSFTLTVDQAPAVTSASNITFVFGAAGAFTITVPGFPFPAISTASPLPNGVTLVDNHNGTATLSGTPQAGSAGAYPVTITASNGVSPNAAQSFTLTVSQVMPTVTWGTPAAITFGSALGGAQLDATASVAGSFVYSPAAGAVLGAGMQSLSVTFTPADATDYTNAAGGVTLTVGKATPTITWATPAAISFGTALGNAQLDAAANTAGVFVYTPAAGASLGAGAQSLSVAFTPADIANYNSATGSVTLTVNKGTPAITWLAPAAITYGVALGNMQLDATANTPGVFVYTPAAAIVPIAGLQTLSVNFIPTDVTDFNESTANNSLTVNKATLTVTANNATSIFGQTPGGFTASYSGFVNGDTAAVLSGAPSLTTTATASSPAGMYAISPAAGTLAAANYTFSFVNGTLTIGKATPVITWATPAAITFGTALNATQQDATANVAGTFAYTPAAGTVVAAGSQSLSVTFTPANATDYTTATGGVTLVVAKATPSITWAAPATINFGTALGSTQLDASANTAGSFVYTPASGTVLDAGSQNLSTAFTPSDAADYVSSSASVTLVVHPASTTTALVASAPSAAPGSSVTFTAAVTSSGGTPAGSVAFFDAATSLGNATLGSGSAAFSTSSLSIGAHSITAVYNGSTDFSSSTSSALTETVAIPAFTVAPASGANSVTVQGGRPVTVPLTVAPVGGFTGVISFSLSGLPPNTTDSFTPPTINLGATPATVGLTLVTSPPVGFVAQHRAPASQVLFAGILWFPVAGMVLAFAGKKNGRGRRPFAALFLLTLAAMAAGVGGCASGGNSRNFREIGTPAGTYTITVTATSGTTHQAIAVITLHVQ